jgi:hypothetical protein
MMMANDGDTNYCNTKPVRSDVFDAPEKLPRQWLSGV